MLQVNYPFPLTDLHQNQKVLRTLQFRAVCKLSLIHIYVAFCVKRRASTVPVYIDPPLKCSVAYVNAGCCKGTLYCFVLSYVVDPVFISAPFLILFFDSVFVNFRLLILGDTVTLTVQDIFMPFFFPTL